MNSNTRKYILAALALFMSLVTFAQSQTQARKWFVEGEYAKAKPVFAKLVKSNPKSGSLNYWYGVCLNETGEHDKALPYLKKAIDSDLTPPEDFTDAIIHIPLEIRATGRNFPTVIQVPFYRKNAVMYPKGTIEDIDWQSDEARELLISYHKTMQP